MSVELRDYQARDLDRILTGLDNAPTMYQLATGGGKTEIMLEAADRMLSDGYPGAVQLVHRIELVGQTFERAEQAGLPVELSYKTGRYVPGKYNVQSIGKARRRRIPQGWPVFIDEAHHATANTWQSLITSHQGPLLGVTATPWRMSLREGFDHLFKRLIVGSQTNELIRDNWLSPLNLVCPVWAENLRREINRDRKNISSMGEYKVGWLAAQDEFRQAMTISPVEEWLNRASDRRTIFFAASQRVAVQQAQHLRANGISVALLLSDEELAEGCPPELTPGRAEAVAGFKSGDIQCLVNVIIVSEGFDCPGASCVVIGRPTLSMAYYRQMVGRALRVADGKPDALVIDCAASYIDDQIGHPLADYPWSLEPRQPTPPGDPPHKNCPGGPDFVWPGTEPCDSVNFTASHYCSGCNLPYGRVCPRCSAWRAWKDWSGETPLEDEYCSLCIEEIKTLEFRTSGVGGILDSHELKDVYQALLTSLRAYYGRRIAPHLGVETHARKATYAALRDWMTQANVKGRIEWDWQTLPDSEDEELVTVVGGVWYDRALQYRAMQLTLWDGFDGPDDLGWLSVDGLDS